MRELDPEKYSPLTYNYETHRWEKPKPPKPETVKKVRKNAASKRSRKIKDQSLIRDSHQCTECGSQKFVCVHHIIPLNQGGKDVLENTKTLCENCHMKKHEKEPVFKIMLQRYAQKQSPICIG